MNRYDIPRYHHHFVTSIKKIKGINLKNEIEEFFYKLFIRGYTRIHEYLIAISPENWQSVCHIAKRWVTGRTDLYFL
jgi:hypothetical protein